LAERFPRKACPRELLTVLTRKQQSLCLHAWRGVGIDGLRRASFLRSAHGAGAGIVPTPERKNTALGDAAIVDGMNALRETVQTLSRKGDMKTQLDDHVPGIAELENKANELTCLMFSMCEERIHNVPVMPDAHTESLANAAMAARYAIKTFLTLERIPPNL